LPRIRTASAPNQANHPDEPHDQLSLTRNTSALSRIFILPISTGVSTSAPGADRAALHRRWQRGVNLDRDAASSLFHHVRCTPDSVSKIRVVASVMTGRGEARLPPLDGRYLAPGAEQTALCIR